MTAVAAADLVCCEGCERRFPRSRLSPVTYYCLLCLIRVMAQTTQEIRALSRA